MTLIPGEHKYKEQPALARKPAERTDLYRTARPVVVSILVGLGALAAPTAAWAHAKLWDHDNEIKVQKEWQRNHDKAEEKMEKRFDRFEAKLDALVESQRHRM